MAQSVIKVSETEYDLEISDKDLAIFYRVFAQKPAEAMRLAKIFGEEEITFAARSADNRKQILAQVNEDELNALVKVIEAEALAEIP